jgi:hypothetical protein
MLLHLLPILLLLAGASSSDVGVEVRDGNLAIAVPATKDVSFLLGDELFTSVREIVATLSATNETAQGCLTELRAEAATLEDLVASSATAQGAATDDKVGDLRSAMEALISDTAEETSNRAEASVAALDAKVSASLRTLAEDVEAANSATTAALSRRTDDLAASVEALSSQVGAILGCNQQGMVFRAGAGCVPASVATASFACNASTTGAIFFNQAKSALELCDGKQLVVFAVLNDGLSPATAAPSCQFLFENAISLTSRLIPYTAADGSAKSLAVRWLRTGGDPFETLCNFNIEHGGGGWTAAGSFVNTDSRVSWGGAPNMDSWRTSSVFGSAETAVAADFKSAAFSTVRGKDLMVQDAYGWISFKGVLSAPGGTLLQLMTSVSTCQTAPLVHPGSPLVDASSAIWKTGGMLVLYAGDPNSNHFCSFTGSHNDGTNLAISGAGCGSMGAGQYGTNYVPSSIGMDWHASLSPASTCIACDGCGRWNAWSSATSVEHNNNAGVHDASKWALVWVR